jgi:DNA invertase Pin-like site-specific DNA recombinase
MVFGTMARKIASDAKPTVLVYVRVSTARQATDGIGLEAQESKCRQHAERMGWTVAEVFRDEGVSGKDAIESRPGLVALIAKAKATPNAVVVVYSVSRLARRQRLLWTLLDEHEGFGLSVSSATESFDTTTPTGRAMLGMIAVFAQLEADMVSERTKDALAEVKARGQKLGRPSQLATNPDAVALVKQLYATGLYSHVTLAEELNRRGTPTASGTGKWWPKTVRTALQAA